MSSADTVTPKFEATPSSPVSRMRWFIALLLFLSTVINYMDRQNLSILARTIQDDLRINDIQYSYVVQAFLLAYTITYVIAGRLTDWLGTRLSMALFVAWWSVSDMLTSLSRSVVSLGFFRFLLGIGEPGNYTAAPKAVSEWFPPKERGLVIGLYTAGATLGATVAPPLVALLAGRFGWRMAFVCTGSLGLLWLIPWLVFYRTPAAAAAEEAAPVDRGRLHLARDPFAQGDLAAAGGPAAHRSGVVLPAVLVSEVPQRRPGTCRWWTPARSPGSSTWRPISAVSRPATSPGC